MNENIIEVKNVTKKFDEATVLNDVSVSFEQGKIHGVIGRNGSGKTVLFKCIYGFMQPTSGTIKVFGKLVKSASLENIGIVIENPGFIGSYSAYKNLKLLASVNRRIKSTEIKEVIERVGLDPESKKNVRKFSLGMKQRLAIAQAIMEKPALLILDEATNGLDKHGISDITDLLYELNNNGVTILMSSHYSEDIETLCHNVYEMNLGVLERIR